MTFLSTKDVLSSKKGMAQALGMTMVGLSMIAAVGVLVANYAIVSKQSSQLQTLSQALTSRAELYASALNADLVSPQVPAMARECTTTPSMCTMIVSATPSDDGEKVVLRIEGETVSGLGQTLAQEVTLVSSEVTHVTALDENGNKIWALSDEGLRYRLWGVADGKSSVITAGETTGPKVEASWVSVADRAGIDSTGSLWVWGANDIGQAGIGTVSAQPIAPTKIEGVTTFRSVVTTDDRSYAIDSAGAPWVWGKNDKGQLSLGHKNPVLTPTKSSSRIMSFAVGKDNVFAITMAGDLAVGGASQAGFPANASNQAQILNPGTKYRAVAASTAGAVAMIDTTGKLAMAGNTYPFTPLAGGNFTSVSLGSTAGYAIGATGALYSWGVGANGQLGLGATTSASTPTAVMPGTKFVAVSGGVTSAFAIDVAGNLYYFGKTPSGSVGGTDLPQVNVPTKLLADSRFRGIASNNSDTRVALLDTAGNVYGMGTAQPGLWPTNYLGPDDQPIRMPVPDGFPTYTWK